MFLTLIRYINVHYLSIYVKTSVTQELAAAHGAVRCVRNCYVASVSETIRNPSLVKAQTASRKNQTNKIWRKTTFNMADGILTPCNVACGSGIMTVNSPSGSTLQCDTWLWDDMPLNSPGGRLAAPCNVTHSSGIMTLNSPGGNTLQCGRWLWDDMP